MMAAVQHEAEGIALQLEASQAHGDASCARFLGPRTASQMRVVAHLWDKRALTRAEIDQIAGRANGPDVMLQLHKLGLTKGRRGVNEQGVCVLSLNRELVDRDGLLVEAGVYRLTDKGLATVRAWFDECDDETAFMVGEALNR